MTIKRLLGSAPNQVSTNKNLGTMAFQDANNANIGGVLSPKTVTFSNLPVASSANGQIYQVSDVGANGSYWKSNGTTWIPVNNTVTLLTGQIPFVIAPTGTITVTTGVLTLGTAIQQYLLSNGSPTKCYMYFPAGAWTGSSAGWYYTTLSSTTAGLVYSNQYTTGQPTIPTSPTLVTTGAGAYIGVTGTILGPNITTPANTIVPNNLLKLNFIGGNNNSVTSKVIGFSSLGTTYLQNITTNTTSQSYGSNSILGVTADNSMTIWSLTSGYIGQGAIRIVTSTTQGFYLSTALATDWVSLSVYDMVLESQ